MEKEKNQIHSFYNFLEDTEGLTEEDMIPALKEQGIHFSELKTKVAEVIKKRSEKRRMAWREIAKIKRSEIERQIESRKIAFLSTDLKNKIKEILAGNFGQRALAHAEAYFRKKDTLTEEDLESLIEDLEDLNLLAESDKEE